MIVKNESSIIVDTLEKLINKIKFDYYVICDTGSTDNTPQLIEEFFNKKKIQGQIKNHQWKDFGYNRSLALECAHLSGCDYVFIFDADDEIIGNLDLSNLSLDSYMLKFGNSDFLYERMCLVRNDGTWCYKGVLHEYICSKNKDSTKGSIEGNYYIISGRTSSRNKDPMKYLRDAEILERGYQTSIETNDGLHHRYAFYCANSYFDSGKEYHEKAKEWYLKTLKCEGWFDERYISCLKLYELLSDESRYYYLIESFYHNPRRVEGIYLLIRHYTCEGKYDIAWKYYLWIQNYYENEYISDNLSTKLFAQVMDYTFYLAYYMIIVSEKTQNYNTGIKMYNIIFDKKEQGPVPGQWWLNNLIYNFQFFEATENLKIKLKEYLDFIIRNGLTFDKSLVKQYIPSKKNNTLLIYTGFSIKPWNMSYSKENAIGGSERAVLSLITYFKNYDITICGDVIEETIDNIRFVNRFNIVKSSHFKIIIISRYVSFFTLFPQISSDYLILMAHDTYFLNNLTGCTKNSKEIIKENESKIDKVVCLTEWHADKYIELYPSLSSKITTINNGINISLNKISKIPNSFIYTSGSIRGLQRLLELWPEISSKLKNATLNLASYEDFPKDDFDNSLNEIIKKHYTIKHFGKLNQSELHILMESSEYWLYPCCFEETSCITALEMLKSEVICLYYPIAGLTETMGGCGVQIKYGNEIETLLNLKNKEELKIKGKEYIQRCTWECRAREWINLMELKVFYAPGYFAEQLLGDYIVSLNKKWNIIFTKDLSTVNEIIDEIIIVHELVDKDVFKKGVVVSYLNTEPLNLECRLNYVIPLIKNNSIKWVYDYSLANIKILNNHGITNTIHLNYLFNKIEVNFLKENYKPIYDFGIICSSGLYTNDPEHLQPPRRQKVVKSILKHGYTVNIISGWGKERDIELGKCKTILNIHGEHLGIPSMVFEHIRCDRLLYAGYNILSETSLDQENIKGTITFKNYNDFFKMKKCYCFIHSCNIKGPKRLKHLLEKLPDFFETIFINNIGPELTETFDKTIITNYSNDNLLFEIPTINKIKQFSEKNPGVYILYIHTKGVSFDDDYQEENDWIDMMLYFLFQENCLELLDTYQTLGCNYTTDGKDYHPDGTTTIAPPHYSGNFWWAQSNYLASLPLIPETQFKKNDAEYWLHSLSHRHFELHHSGIDHYRERYPKEKYLKCIEEHHQLDTLD